MYTCSPQLINNLSSRIRARRGRASLEPICVISESWCRCKAHYNYFQSPQKQLIRASRENIKQIIRQSTLRCIKRIMESWVQDVESGMWFSKMALKLLRCFSLLVIISMVTFTAVVLVPSANISNLFSDYEESSLEFQFLENATDNFDRQLKVKLDRNSYCKKLQAYYGLPDNLHVGVGRQEKIFIIVAYRDRQEHKSVFMNEMTKYLQQKVSEPK